MEAGAGADSATGSGADSASMGSSVLAVSVIEIGLNNLEIVLVKYK